MSNVPPAAAPVGELRDKVQMAIRFQEGAERKAYGNIGIVLKLLREIKAALAAAPFTGDRETAGVERDVGGRIVREAWVRWALTQPNPKATWLVPYDELSEPDKEADRQIYEACRATPPSGAGDHAGGEAVGPERAAELVALMDKAAPGLLDRNVIVTGHGLREIIAAARATAAPASGVGLREALESIGADYTTPPHIRAIAECALAASRTSQTKEQN